MTLAVVAVVAVGFVGVVACSSDDRAVAMRLIAFKPSELEVPTGTSVTWTQQDAGFHTVTSGRIDRDASGSVETKPDGAFASGRLAKGKEFTFAFDENGSYTYFCEIHPATMTGHVTVE